MPCREMPSRATGALLFPARLCHMALRWIWKHRDPVATWVFRIITLLSFVYLVFDRIDETGVTISSSDSDPKQPFFYPFSISNNSRIFTLRNIKWKCVVDEMIDANDHAIEIDKIINGKKHHISPGDAFNIYCRFPTPDQSVQIRHLSMHIDLYYDTNLLWIKTLRRNPITRFTWSAAASNPRWIRGE
jgi:hypothetical protein